MSTNPIKGKNSCIFVETISLIFLKYGFINIPPHSNFLYCFISLVPLTLGTSQLRFPKIMLSTVPALSGDANIAWKPTTASIGFCIIIFQAVGSRLQSHCLNPAAWPLSPPVKAYK